MAETESKTTSGRFDVMKLAAELPDDAKSMLVDTYLTDRESASARIFRVLRAVPAHYHETCDEFLYVLTGRGTFWIDDVSDTKAFGPGELLVFERKHVHSVPEILEHPLTVLAIDTPRRDPKDIVFVDSKDGTAADFMARNAEGD